MLLTKSSACAICRASCRATYACSSRSVDITWSAACLIWMRHFQRRSLQESGDGQVGLHCQHRLGIARPTHPHRLKPHRRVIHTVQFRDGCHALLDGPRERGDLPAPAGRLLLSSAGGGARMTASRLRRNSWSEADRDDGSKVGVSPDCQGKRSSICRAYMGERCYAGVTCRGLASARLYPPV